MKPFITCICPTYKRPECLANVVKCFETQDYPHDRRGLIILDDANQHPQQTGPDGPWYLFNGNREELNTLPKKFNKIMEHAKSTDLFAVWEDDDVYFPHHLELLSRALERGGEFITPHRVFSTYGQDKGNLQVEEGAGRFHGSWAFTPKLIESVGGYPETGLLNFDGQLHQLLRDAGTQEYGVRELDYPSYVYRWGNGVYHGSQAGVDGYDELWAFLGNLPFEPVPVLEPRFDKESKELVKKFIPGFTSELE